MSDRSALSRVVGHLSRSPLKNLFGSLALGRTRLEERTTDRPTDRPTDRRVFRRRVFPLLSWCARSLYVFRGFFLLGSRGAGRRTVVEGLHEGCWKFKMVGRYIVPATARRGVPVYGVRL